MTLILRQKFFAVNGVDLIEAVQFSSKAPSRKLIDFLGVLLGRFEAIVFPVVLATFLPLGKQVFHWCRTWDNFGRQLLGMIPLALQNFFVISSRKQVSMFQPCPTQCLVSVGGFQGMFFDLPTTAFKIPSFANWEDCPTAGGDLVVDGCHGVSLGFAGGDRLLKAAAGKQLVYTKDN